MIIKLSKSDDYATMEQMITNFFRVENAYKKKVKRLKAKIQQMDEELDNLYSDAYMEE